MLPGRTKRALFGRIAECVIVGCALWGARDGRICPVVPEKFSQPVPEVALDRGEGKQRVDEKTVTVREERLVAVVEDPGAFTLRGGPRHPVQEDLESTGVGRH